MSKLRYGPKSFEPAGEVDTAFLRRLKQYDDDVGKVVADKNKWQLVAFICLGLTVAGFAGMLYGISLPKTIPMVIKVSPWGEAEYVGDISQSNVSEIPEESYKYYLEEFVNKTRSVSADMEVVYSNLNDAFDFVTSNASTMLADEVKKNDIVNKVGSQRTKVNIETTIRLTTGSWQVDWTEQDLRMDGQLVTERRYRGVYYLKREDPDEKIKRRNPFGIFIDSYEIEPVR